jgi:catechol 2,3-dioxygenase-like lactoylglutathione lyase family enzyme
MTEAPPNRVGEVVPFLRVADMERSLRYYVDGMGFAIAQRWVDGGSVRWCRLERGGAALMLQDFQTDTGDRWSPGGELGLGVAIVFICEDAVALWREAAGRGLELSRPFVGNGMWVTTATDPDGYRVEIESPTDAAEGTVLGTGEAVA